MSFSATDAGTQVDYSGGSSANHRRRGAPLAKGPKRRHRGREAWNRSLSGFRVHLDSSSRAFLESALRLPATSTQSSSPWSPLDLRTNDHTLAFRPTHDPRATRCTGHLTPTAQTINLLRFHPKILATTRSISALYRPRFHQITMHGHGIPASAFTNRNPQAWLSLNHDHIGQLRSARS